MVPRASGGWKGAGARAGVSRGSLAFAAAVVLTCQGEVRLVFFCPPQRINNEGGRFLSPYFLLQFESVGESHHTASRRPPMVNRITRPNDRYIPLPGGMSTIAPLEAR